MGVSNTEYEVEKRLSELDSASEDAVKSFASSNSYPEKRKASLSKGTDLPKLQ